MTEPVPPAAPEQPAGLTYRDLQRTLFLGFGLLLIWHLAAPLTTLLLFFLLVFIVSAVLNPAVLALQRLGVPRLAGAVALAVLLLTGIGLLAWLALDPLLGELARLFGSLGQKQEQVSEYYTRLVARYPQLREMLPDPQVIFQNLTPRLTAFLGTLGGYTVNAVVGVASLFLLMVLVIYTVGNPQPLVMGLLGAVSERHRGRVASALRRILEQLKSWAVGSLVLGLIVGVMIGVALGVLGLVRGTPFPYLLLFSVLAGVGELIPNIGPILSAIPPALIALTIDPWLALWVVLIFVVVQQLENNVIVPLVMGQSLQLHPLSVTFSVLVMGVLFGLLGAVLAVPVTAILKVCWEEFYLIPRRTDSAALDAIAEEIVQNHSRRRDRAAAGASSRESAEAGGGTDGPGADGPGADGPETGGKGPG